MIEKMKIMILIFKTVYFGKKGKKEYLKKIYSFDNSCFEQKIITRTKMPTFRNYITLSKSEKGKKRVYFGELKNNYFIIYTIPNMPSENKLGSRITIWQHMSIWASPTQICGKISEKNGETLINYKITKDNDTYSLYNFFIFLFCIVIITGIIKVFFYGFSSFELSTLLLMTIAIVVLSYTASAVMYIPDSEKEALLKFLEDLEQ